MKRVLIIAGLAVVAAAASTAAHADNVYWSVGVNAPLNGYGHIHTVVGNMPPAPVIVAPLAEAPPQPVVVSQAHCNPAMPVAYYGPVRYVYGYPGYWGHRRCADYREHEHWEREHGDHGRGGWDHGGADRGDRDHGGHDGWHR